MPVKTLPNQVSLTIRRATPADAAAILDLAALDSSSIPPGDLLVADVGGDLWAAVSLEDFQAIADPFRPSSELTGLLIERARQLRNADRAPGRRLRLPRLHTA